MFFCGIVSLGAHFLYMPRWYVGNRTLDQWVAKEKRWDHCILWCVTSIFFYPCETFSITESVTCTFWYNSELLFEPRLEKVQTSGALARSPVPAGGGRGESALIITLPSLFFLGFIFINPPLMFVGIHINCCISVSHPINNLKINLSLRFSLLVHFVSTSLTLMSHDELLLI